MLVNFDKSVRCQCRNLTNNLICKKKEKTLYKVENKLYCINHYHYYRDKYAIKIQSVYKGYRQRKLINIVYKRLPDDIQRKILYYVKRNTYIKRYINAVKKAVVLRLDNFIRNIENMGIRRWNYWDDDRKLGVYILNNENKVIESCYLYNKYYKILDNEYKEPFIYIVKTISNIINGMEFIRNFDETPDGIKLKKLYNLYVKMEWLIRPNRW
tara:strand:+ start:333 stop:968 length:636 start_codon:yes stop_codon:yes gene_type:complete